jgi:hypothetical protein
VVADRAPRPRPLPTRRGDAGAREPESGFRRLLTCATCAPDELVIHLKRRAKPRNRSVASDYADEKVSTSTVTARTCQCRRRFIG